MNGLKFMKLNLKNKFTLKAISFFFIFLLFAHCKNSQNLRVKNGDLLFVTAKESGLSGAINKVTKKQENASFDHIGILQKQGKSVFVLHAAPQGGSQKQNLDAFLKDQTNEGQKVVLYRLKPHFQHTIPKAIEKANSMLGKPYNFNYILDENSYYCSDYIERSFREDHIFNLEPMTFIDPGTREINIFWQKFYAEKNLKVPQGEPGCNPNGLAASDKIERIREL